MIRVLAAATFAMITNGSVSLAQNALMSSDAMAAMANVKIISQELTQNAFGPVVLVRVSNESDFSFRLLQLSCALMDGDKAVGTVDAQIFGLLPKTTALAEGSYEVTAANDHADNAECRPAIAG